MARSARRAFWERWSGPALVAALPLFGCLLGGCQSVQGVTPETMVRVIDASYNAPAIDVTVGGTPIAANIAGPTITNYAFLPAPETTTAYIYPTGTKKATATVATTLQASTEHSIYITDSGAGYSATLLTDQIATPPAGDIAFRFLQQAQTTGPVDIYLVPGGSDLTGTKPLLTDQIANSITGYLDVPAGTYTLVVTPTGTTKTKFTSASLDLSAGAVRTVLIMDAQLTSNPPVTVVIGDDLN